MRSLFSYYSQYSSKRRGLWVVFSTIVTKRFIDWTKSFWISQERPIELPHELHIFMRTSYYYELVMERGAKRDQPWVSEDVKNPIE
jgi:hypothetical protein